MRLKSLLVPYIFWLLLTVIPAVALGDDRSAPVTITKVERGVIYTEVPLSGSVMARRLSALSSEVDGLVSEILVDDGDSVKTGDVLIKLDESLAKLELARAEAAREEERARLKEAVRQRNEAAGLVKKNHVAQSLYKGRIAEVAIRSAALKRLDAEYRQKREIVDQHTISAPFSGIIGKKLAEVGQWVETGSSVLELVEIDVLRLDVPVPQRYFGRIAIGTPVDVSFDAFPEQPFSAAVTMKIPVASAAARSFPVRIEIDNINREKAPGMSARVVFKLKQANSAPVLRVPKDAIVKATDGAEVIWRLNGEAGGDLHVSPVTIQTGRSNKAYIEVLAGRINEGDRIVVRGNETLRPGQRVQIRQPD